MKIKIQDAEGVVREAHCCFGYPEECEVPAVCEVCGRSATVLVPVVVISDEESGYDEILCGIHAQHQGISVSK